MSGYDDANDGGIRQWEEERFAREDARLLEEHKKWMREFNLGLPNTKPKSGDNTTNDTTTEKTT